VGRVEHVAEERLEVVLPARCAASVLQALRSAHPYEEPAYDLLELVDEPGPRGLGRVGELPRPTTLRELTRTAADVLPATRVGRARRRRPGAGGHDARRVRRLGDSLLREAGRAADAYLTADLRHHPASEAPEGLALLDAAHWATEHPWLADAARRLSAATTVETVVSDTVTDPWTQAARSSPA
jgi:putative NIF3 family GTP cyclohydrolase 1 type 2